MEANSKHSRVYQGHQYGTLGIWIRWGFVICHATVRVKISTLFNNMLVWDEQEFGGRGLTQECTVHHPLNPDM